MKQAFQKDIIKKLNSSKILETKVGLRNAGKFFLEFLVTIFIRLSVHERDIT